jgi:hypothetical protein
MPPDRSLPPGGLCANERYAKRRSVNLADRADDIVPTAHW